MRHLLDKSSLRVLQRAINQLFIGARAFGQLLMSSCPDLTGEFKAPVLSRSSQPAKVFMILISAGPIWRGQTHRLVTGTVEDTVTGP